MDSFIFCAVLNVRSIHGLYPGGISILKNSYPENFGRLPGQLSLMKHLFCKITEQIGANML